MGIWDVSSLRCWERVRGGVGRWRKVRAGFLHQREERIGNKADISGVVQGSC